MDTVKLKVPWTVWTAIVVLLVLLFCVNCNIAACVALLSKEIKIREDVAAMLKNQ